MKEKARNKKKKEEQKRVKINKKETNNQKFTCKS